MISSLYPIYALQITLFTGKLSGVRGLSDWTSSISNHTVELIKEWVLQDYGILPHCHLIDHQLHLRTTLSYFNHEEKYGHTEFNAALKILILGQF